MGLFFLEDPVASALQLIRRVMQPQSTDVPHITLRYSDIQIPPSFQAVFSSTQVDRVVLEAPGTFDLAGYEQGLIGTTFLRCGAPRLESIAYKPDFPDSIFHVTLYEGRPSGVAFELLQLLRAYPWNLEYSPGQSVIMSFEAFRGLRSDINGAPGALTTGAADLFQELTGRAPTIAALHSVTADAKLDLIDQIVRRVHSAENVKPLSVVSRQVESKDHLVFHRVHQPQLLSDTDLGIEETAHAKSPEETATVITPPEIAAEVVDQALQHLLPEQTKISLLDPAIGGGVFFATLEAKTSPATKTSLARITSAIGIEKRIQRAGLTQHAFDGSNLRVVVADFLSVKPADIRTKASDESLLPNLLLANPPYMRPSLDSSNAYEVARDQIRDRLGITLSKRANLYIYFMLHADAFLDHGAVAAWVLPGEVLYSDSAEPVRRYLMLQVDLLSVHVYTDAMRFHRKRVSTVVVTYRKGAPSRSGRVHWSQGDSLLTPERERDVDRHTLTTEAKWNSSWILGASTPRAGGVELGALFTVSRGIATGANNIFVVDDEVKESLRLEESCLRVLLPKPRELFGSIIEATSSGLPEGYSPRWLIDSKLPWRELERLAPRLHGYLSEHMSVADLALPKRRSPFYRQEQQLVPPIVFISMTGATRGGDRFILNASLGRALNNYHVVRPNALLSDWMKKSGVKMSDVHRALQDVRAEDLLTIGRLFHRGSVKLEPGDLRRVPLRNSLFLKALSSATDWEGAT